MRQLKITKGMGILVGVLAALFSPACGNGSDDDHGGTQPSSGGASAQSGGTTSMVEPTAGAPTGKGGATMVGTGAAGSPAAAQGGQAGAGPITVSGAGDGGATDVVAPGAAGSGGGEEEVTSSPMLVFVAGAAAGQSNVYGLSLADDKAAVVLLSTSVPPGYQAGHPSVSPTGDSVAFVVSNSQAQNELWVVGTDASNPHAVTEAAIPGDSLGQVLWSPDAQSLAYTLSNATSTRLIVVNVDGSGRRLLAESENGFRELQWASDSSRIAYVVELSDTDPPAAYVVERRQGSPRSLFLAEEGGDLHLAGWSRDSTWLALSHFETTWSADAFRMTDLGQVDLGVLDANQQAPRWSPVSDASLALLSRGELRLGNVIESASQIVNTACTNFRWSPDGTYLAYAEMAGVLQAVRVPASSQVGENYALSGTLKDNGVMGVFDWSPDSRYVAYAAHERVAQIEELFLVPANGEGSHRISGVARAGTGVDSISFSPDSQFVAYVANHQTPSAFQLFVSNLAGDQNLLVGTAQRGAVWSRDSAYLAVRQDTDSSVVVFDSAAYQTFPLADRLPAELQVSKTEKLDFAVSHASH